MGVEYGEGYPSLHWRRGPRRGHPRKFWVSICMFLCIMGPFWVYTLLNSTGQAANLRATSGVLGAWPPCPPKSAYNDRWGWNWWIDTCADACILKRSRWYFRGCQIIQSSCQFQPISSWNGGGIGSNKYGLCKWTVTKTCLPTRRQEKLVDTYFTVNVFLYKEAYSGNVCQTGSSQSVLIKAVVVKLV